MAESFEIAQPFQINSPVVFDIPNRESPLAVVKTTTMQDAKPFYWFDTANGHGNSYFSKMILKKTWITRMTIRNIGITDGVQRQYVLNVINGNTNSGIWASGMATFFACNTSGEEYDFNITTPIFIERQNIGDYLYWFVSPAVNGVLDYLIVDIWGFEIDE